MTLGDTAVPGDVVIRQNRTGVSPAFVLSVTPGPDQCGCPTLAAASTLAEAFARHSGVDVWVEDAGRALTAVARFRGEPRGAMAAASAGDRAVPHMHISAAPDSAARARRGAYGSAIVATRARVAVREGSRWPKARS